MGPRAENVAFAVLVGGKERPGLEAGAAQPVLRGATGMCSTVN